MVSKSPGVYKIVADEVVVYVGASINVHKRFISHKWRLKYRQHPNVRLQKLFDSGVELLYVVIELCEADSLAERENYYTELLQPSCNVTKHEKNAQLSKILSGRGPTHPDTIAKIKAARANSGPLSDETKSKLSKSHKGKQHSQEAKDKMSAAKLGVKISDNTKLKLSQAAWERYYGKKG